MSSRLNYPVKTVPKILFFMALTVGEPAWGGSPFLTDDPVTLDYRHYEAYLFTNLAKTNVSLEEPQLQAPAFEIDWGVLPNVELDLVIPYVWSLPSAAPAADGIGDIGVTIKFRFIQETENRPQVAIAPTVDLPTGDVNQDLGNGESWMKLPVSLQKSWGTWTTYGGVGYALNSAPEARNYPYAGWELQKDLNEKLTLGVEIFSQGAVTTESSSSAIVNAGGYYNFTKQFSILFSAGHSVLGEEYLVSYLGLYWTGEG